MRKYTPLNRASGSASHQNIVLGIILVSYFMIVLDISIVITALPKIQSSLGFTATGLSWVQNAYTLGFGGFLLLGARAGDILGRRLMFMVGLAIFTITSVAIGLAPSPAILVAARALQGLGAAVLAPSTLALLSTVYVEGPERTRAIGYYGAVAGIGASVGLVLGGVLTDWLSWRVGFFINLPIGIALIFSAKHYLPESQKQVGEFDILGAVISMVGMSTLVYGIVQSATTGWRDELTLATVAAGMVLLALFFLVEQQVKQPVLPLRLFSNSLRTGAYSARFLYLGAMLGFWFFTTQFLQNVLGYSPLKAGFAFLPMTIANFIVAINVAAMTQKIGNAKLLIFGIAFTLLGTAWLSRVTIDSSYGFSIALPMILIGIGQGATLGPLTYAGVARVAPEDAGAASGLVNVAHQLGGSMGLSILVVAYASGSHLFAGKQMLAEKISRAFEAASILLAFAFLIVLFFIIPDRKAKAVN